MADEVQNKLRELDTFTTNIINALYEFPPCQRVDIDTPARRLRATTAKYVRLCPKLLGSNEDNEKLENILVGLNIKLKQFRRINNTVEEMRQFHGQNFENMKCCTDNCRRIKK